MAIICRITDDGITSLFKVNDDEANTGVRAAFADANDANEIHNIQPNHYNSDGSLECTAVAANGKIVTFTSIPDNFKII